MTWNFAYSTGASTWADGGRKFGELMEKAPEARLKLMFMQLTNWQTEISLKESKLVEWGQYNFHTFNLMIYSWSEIQCIIC